LGWRVCSTRYLRVEPIHGLGQHIELSATVVIVAVNRLTAVTARRHMVDRAREFNSKGRDMRAW